MKSNSVQGFFGTSGVGPLSENGPAILVERSNQLSYRKAIDNSHYRLISKLGKEMQINHHN